MSESLLKAGRVRPGEALETTAVRAHIEGMDALTLQLIAWVSDRPRTYGEVMEAWTTTCPRMPIWEDAVSDGLVRVEGEGRMRERCVSLTPRGRAVLRENARMG
jgi:DNA-binding PadR family transcriptional regulator